MIPDLETISPPSRRQFLTGAATALAVAAVPAKALVMPQSISAREIGIVADGRRDNARAIEGALARLSRGGGTLRLPAARAPYMTGQVRIPSNVTLVIERGAVLRPVRGTAAVLRVTRASNVAIEGGGKIDGQGHASSAIVLEGARAVKIRNLEVVGLGRDRVGRGNDGIYVGAAGAEPSRDVSIDNVTIPAAGRNGISIVAAIGCSVTRCDLSGAGRFSAPGAGIDVEANHFNKTGRIRIENNRVHGNAGVGIGVIFGEDVVIARNEVFNNGKQGILTGAGGAQFVDGVARRDIDLLTLRGFEGRRGHLRVGGWRALAVGTPIAFRVARGARLPSELRRQTRWFVFDKPADGIIRISADGATPLAAFGSGGGDIQLVALARGQASNIRITGNRVYGNSTKGGGAEEEIGVSTSLDVSVADNVIEARGNNHGIKLVYSKDVTVRNNTISGRGGPRSFAVTMAGSSFVTMSGNEARGYGANCIRSGNMMRSNIGSAISCG